LYAVIVTFIYFNQLYITKNYAPAPGSYADFFAYTGITVNIALLVFQLFFASRFIQKAGIKFVAISISTVFIAGLVCFSIYSSYLLIVVLLSFSKVASYSVIRPMRELLSYQLQSKNKKSNKFFLDTIVYRGGDVLAGFLFVLLLNKGFSVGELSLIAAGICLMWVLIVLKLNQLNFKTV
jgi:ATP:ADP antiporter, AAA family